MYLIYFIHVFRPEEQLCSIISTGTLGHCWGAVYKSEDVPPSGGLSDTWLSQQETAPRALSLSVCACVCGRSWMHASCLLMPRMKGMHAGLGLQLKTDRALHGDIGEPKYVMKYYWLVLLRSTPSALQNGPWMSGIPGVRVFHPRRALSPITVYSNNGENTIYSFICSECIIYKVSLCHENSI